MAERVVTGVCHHDCPDSCVWDVTVRDGQAVRLRGQASSTGPSCRRTSVAARSFHDDLVEVERL